MIAAAGDETARVRFQRRACSTEQAARAVPVRRANKCRRGLHPSAGGAAGPSASSAGGLPHLSMREPQRRGGFLQSARQCAGQRHRHRAAPLRKWNQGPTKSGMEQAGFDCAFELIVVGNDKPARIAGSRNEFLRDRLARNPNLRIGVTDRVGDAEHLGRQVGGIAPGAGVFEPDRRSRFASQKTSWHAWEQGAVRLPLSW